MIKPQNLAKKQEKIKKMTIFARFLEGIVFRNKSRQNSHFSPFKYFQIVPVFFGSGLSGLRTVKLFIILRWVFFYPFLANKARNQVDKSHTTKCRPYHRLT
jgi:hypothetical protein